MNLSNNLKLSEVTLSDTAKRLGILNVPNETQLNCLKLIAENIFQPIREAFCVPIYVSSGFRSFKLNKAIGGSNKSQHSKGQALDLDADRYGLITNSQIFNFIKENLSFDQLIWEFGDEKEPDWVHVSYVSKEKNRGQILKAYKDRGTKYKLY